MPITKGAAKAHRASNRKRVFNVRRNSAMKSIVKDIKIAVVAGEIKKAEEMLPKVYKAIDKAEKRGLLKKNTAARKKSRLVAMIKKSKK